MHAGPPVGAGTGGFEDPGSVGFDGSIYNLITVMELPSDGINVTKFLRRWAFTTEGQLSERDASQREVVWSLRPTEVSLYIYYMRGVGGIQLYEGGV